MAEITIRVSNRALKVALVVFGVVLLVWGFSRLWSSGVFHPKYQIQIFVPEANGVRVGAPVRLDGIPIGSVSKVDPAGDSADSNRRVEVALRIEKRFQNVIRNDSTASLAPDGLLGGTYVNIIRGFSGPPVSAGGEIRVVPVKQISLTDFIEAIDKTAGCQNEKKNSLENKPLAITKKSQDAQ